jgi:S-ribosylhomocysteine lyase LuxS involved in autoinducer biosynthesis
MDINKLQKALAIMNRDGKSGNVFAEHDELFLWPNADSFSKEEVKTLERLGFRMNDEGGFECFT